MEKKQAGLTALYSCLFSACVTVGRRITFGGDVMMKNAETFIDPLSVWDALIFAAVAVAAACMLRLAERLVDGCARQTAGSLKKRRDLRFAVLSALCLLAAWLPHILSVAPGNIYLDSLESISQMLEHGHPTSNHHPMFYTLMVGVFLKIGSVLFGSVNTGVLLYSLFQTCVMIFCMVCVLTIMYHKQMLGWILGISLAYFMFVPFFPSYAMSMWKDALFSCMLLLLSLLLYALIAREEIRLGWFVCFAAVGIGAMMMRNNGVYVFIAAAMLAAFFVRRHAKRLLLAAAAAVAAFGLLSSLATAVWNIHGDFVENVGIPLQQLGYTLNHDGEFSEEDRQYLYELAPQDVWGYAYRPCLVDSLKWNPQFDTSLLEETKAQFFCVWLRGLLKNPGEYVEAYLLATHGFWKPGVQNLYGYMDVQMNDNAYGIGFMDLFEKLFGFSILPILKDYPVILGSGTLLWLCLLGCVLACMRRWDGCVPYMPALLNWATVMIATPVAYSLRYVYVFALGLPLYLTLPLMLRGAHFDI